MSSKAEQASSAAETSSLEDENHQLKVKIRQLLSQAKKQQDLLALFSHEIKTPLGGIISLVEFLQNTSLTPSQTLYVNTLAFAAENLAKATEDMLDFARLKSGHLNVEPKQVNLQELLSSIALLIAPRAEAKGLKFKAVMEQDVPKVISVDPSRLNQIINNLANNALKFTDQGSISLRVSAKHLATNEHLISIELEDTGIGISENELDEIFKPFVQASNAGKTITSGSGLGLWISKQIAKGLNGSITCTSQKNQGSCFTLSFKTPIIATDQQPETSFKKIPATEIPATEIPASEIAPPIAEHPLPPLAQQTPLNEPPIGRQNQQVSLKQSDQSAQPAIEQTEPIQAEASETEQLLNSSYDMLQGHVLIVEDNKLNQMLIKVYLEKFGLTFDTVENGLEALEAVKKAKYDLILMDMMMPEMDGLTAAHELHLLWGQEQHIPMIALSASANETSCKDYEKAGIEAYVAKPIRGEIFYNALVEFLPKSQQLTNKTSAAPDETPPTQQQFSA